MSIDIRLPIGLMFTILGLILVVFGVLPAGRAQAAQSLGVNVDLWWGLVILGFGVIMLALAALGRHKVEPPPHNHDGPL